MSQKFVYLFSEGNGSMRELLGGKGANLAEMTNLGMPVPQGFTITTEACTQYYHDGRQINEEIQAQIYEYLGKMEEICGKKFADPENPLLVSVRSGARASMPGMMDTILNLGLNDVVVEGLARFTNNPRFAYDSYRRFIQMFSDVVMELSKKRFEEIIDEVKAKKGVKQDVELDTDDMKNLVVLFKEFYKKEKGEDFPQDPKVQLMEAVKAVFRSWDNPRANVYRVPPHERDPLRLGHRRQRAEHGVRQLRQQLRHRRGLHPQPRHRREGPVRRVPDQRPGRGRGGRRAHPLPHLQAPRGDA